MLSNQQQIQSKSQCFDLLVKTNTPKANIMNYLIGQMDKNKFINRSAYQLYQDYRIKNHLQRTKALQKNIDNILSLLIRHHIISGYREGQPNTSLPPKSRAPKGSKIKYYNVDPMNQAKQIIKRLNYTNPSITQKLYEISIQDPKNGAFITNVLNTNFKKGRSLLRAYFSGLDNYYHIAKSYKINTQKLHKIQQRIQHTDPDKVAHAEYHEIADFMKEWGRHAALQAYYAFTQTNNPQHYQQLAPSINKRLTILCNNLSRQGTNDTTNE